MPHDATSDVDVGLSLLRWTTSFVPLVFYARFTPMAELNAGAHARRNVSVVILSTLVALTSLTVVFVHGPAGADQISDLKAQAQSISQKLVRQQLQIDAYQQQYSVLSETVAADARAIDQIGAEISQDEQQIGAKTHQVRHTAIMSYMNSGSQSSNSDVTLFIGNGEKAQAASEYSTIAVGNITTALDQLHTAQRTLQAHETDLQRQQALDQANRAQQGSDLAQATGTEQQMQSVQAQVTGQLAAAVAQQAAVENAAAVAAVAAAQRSAANSSGSRAPSSPVGTPPQAATSRSPAPGSTTTGPPPAGNGGSPGTTDPALNSFLQCVVQAESGGNYGAVSPNGEYMGAFQFSQSTWNTAALAAGRPDLVGVPPNLASKADQDTLAVALYALDGQQPWLGDRCSS